MWHESELQHIVPRDVDDIFAELDAIGAPTEQPANQSETAPETEPVTTAPHVSGRFKAAIETWTKRHEAYKANPDTYEAALGRRIEDENRKGWRAEYAVRVGRDVRSYERDQTPERRKEKKAAKSKEERQRRDERSTPAEIEARRADSRRRAKESYERRKGTGPQIEPARPEHFGKFGNS